LSVLETHPGPLAPTACAILTAVKALVALAMFAACRKDAPPAPKVAPLDKPAVAVGIPPLSGGGDRAYVADAAGLVEVAMSGTSQVLAKEAVRWCGADARAGVVWFVTDHGLSVFDLEDRRIYPVIVGDLGVRDAENARVGDLAVVIDWGKQKLGGESPVQFEVGLSLTMTDHPQLAMVMGCEGDRAVYCFGDDERPVPSVAALQAHVKDLSLADPGYVARLAKRGASRSLWSPGQAAARPPAPPKLDRTECSEAPDRCGVLTAVPGHPVWLVVTGNSRGDFFYETRELWDPATSEFVRVANRTIERTTTLPSASSGTDYDGLRVSPSGLSVGGRVFDTTHVIHAPGDGGLTCGWASGGWRIPGPTDR
jgi:hypothetical protein